MSGKCRPSLMKNIPDRLAVSNLSMTVKECILEVFRRYQEMRPCNIGDTVWCLRSYKGIPRPKKGTVTEMFFVGKEMDLCIVVGHLARGKWGESVFPTEEDAIKKIQMG